MRRLFLFILLAALMLPRSSAAAIAVPSPITHRWAIDDAALADGEIHGTWTWGPLIERTGTEPYAEAPDGQRSVWYLDKARMEITDPEADSDSEWYVTTGLLAREMISGQMQLGDGVYESWQPAAVPVAGDLEASLGQTITYADLHPVASLHGDRAAPSQLASTAPITATLAPGGVVGSDVALADWNVRVAAYDDVSGHNLPDVFVKAFDPAHLLYVAGHPLTEPYWVQVPVRQVWQPVLLQAFERRVLTYTPANPPEWQVEWGNVGRQYAEWRYGSASTGTPINPNSVSTAAARALRDLSLDAANIAQTRKGYVGVAVYNLATDELHSFQGTRRFKMYSTVKVPIMLTVLDRAVREERRVTEHEQQLIEAMIQLSDNNAATALLNSVGGAQAVEQFLRRNRINDTYIEADAWGASTTTAQDMARLMARLGHCMMLVQRLCNYALETMRGVVSYQAWGVTGGVPSNTPVALKNGWYPDRGGWGINSMGLVRGQGKSYAIAVFTWPDPSMAYGVETIERVSAAVYASIP